MNDREKISVRLTVWLVCGEARWRELKGTFNGKEVDTSEPEVWILSDCRTKNEAASLRLLILSRSTHKSPRKPHTG